MVLYRFPEPAVPAAPDVAALYTDHHKWLHAWLRRKLGCSHRAADLAHDTFLRLLSRDEPIAIQEPRAFLTTVAQRVLSNHWRREHLERAYLETLALQPEALAPSPEERHLILSTLIEIDALLATLPDEVRHAFLLSQLDGLNQSRIAARLGISVTTVKRHLVRAGTLCYFALDIA
ncbi:sigma-70 family RNA polymerase sigma factor [Thauera linaloolentis]|nr:sigma-70 family RNA polymerase sigma factor [Thauera linaloolentis]MCM8564485.1 sigma-70 family RNA polymerase sigma factor [Thauera linaloolentis]